MTGTFHVSEASLDRDERWVMDQAAHLHDVDDSGALRLVEGLRVPRESVSPEDYGAILHHVDDAVRRQLWRETDEQGRGRPAPHR